MGNIAQFELHDAAYCVETTYGTLPGSPTWKKLWHNGLALQPVRETLQSKRKLGDRTSPLPRLGKKSCAGSMDSELAYVAFDDFLEALFNGTFPTAFTAVSGTTIAAVAASQTITDSGSGFGSVSAGDWVTISGFTNSANNGTFKVTAASAGSLTLAYGSTSLVDEAAGATVSVSQQIRMEALSSSTPKSFCVQGRYTDLSSVEHLFKGVMVKSATFNVVPKDITKVSFQLLGNDFDKAPTALSSIGTHGDYEAFDALSGTFTEADTATTKMTNLTMTVENNNSLADKALGLLVAEEQFQGHLSISGSVRFYFTGNSLVTKFWDETETSLEFSVSDPDGNDMTFGLPSVKLTDMDLKKGESDIEAEVGFNFTAGIDPTTGVIAYVIKTPA